MNRDRTLLLVILLLTTGLTVLKAQSDVLTAGGEASGTGGSGAYSIGQTNYTYYSGDAGSLSLGVQQPYVVIMVGTSEPDITLSATVYPNPTNSSVNLRIEQLNPGSKTDHLSYALYDMNGKLILQHEITNAMTAVPFDNLSNAVYILRIMQSNTNIKEFKIFKTN